MPYFSIPSYGSNASLASMSIDALHTLTLDKRYLSESGCLTDEVRDDDEEGRYLSMPLSSLHIELWCRSLSSIPSSKGSFEYFSKSFTVKSTDVGCFKPDSLPIGILSLHPPYEITTNIELLQEYGYTIQLDSSTDADKYIIPFGVFSKFVRIDQKHDCFFELMRDLDFSSHKSLDNSFFQFLISNKYTL